MRSAKLLIINLGGIGTEIIKNLALGGLNSIEILDGSTIKEEDYAAQFFLPSDDSIIGELKLPHVLPAIKELNPRVDLRINTSKLSDVAPEYFGSFDLVVATELTKKEIIDINTILRNYGIPFYVTGMHGMFGYIFSDLIKHESRIQTERGNQPREVNLKINDVKTITKVEYKQLENVELVTIEDEFFPLSGLFTSSKLTRQLNKRQLKRLSPALPLILSLFEVEKPSDPEQNLDKELLRKLLLEKCESLDILPTIVSEEYLDLFSAQAFTEFAPVASILGGFLAQDVIQFLGQKESPINNCLILDSHRSEIPIYYL